MGILQGLFAYLRKSVGKLLQAIFGWVVHALFGTVAESEATMLSVVVGAAAAWPLLLIGIPFPKMAALIIAFVPIPKWVSPDLIRIFWIVAAVIVPTGVAAALARRGTARVGDSVWKTFLSGFPVTVAIAAAFVTAFFTAPIRRLIALARRRQDATIPLVLNRDEYAAEAEAIGATLRDARFDLERADPPWLLTAPSRVLGRLGGERLRSRLPRNLYYYRSETLEVSVAPNAVTIQGAETDVARAHALVCEKATLGPGLQTVGAEAQAIEKQLKDIWAVFDRDRPAHEKSALLRSGIDAVSERLAETDLSFEDWQVLYREILQVSRAIEGDGQLLGTEKEKIMSAERKHRRRSPSAPPKTSSPPSAFPAVPVRRVSDLSTPQLVAGLTVELRELIAREMDLVKTEIRIDLKSELKSARWLGIAAILALVFLDMLFVAGALWLAQWIAPPLAALAVAGGLLVLAGVFALAGKAALVRPLEKTRQTLTENWTWAKNRIA